jgi:hypothetical protein
MYYQRSEIPRLSGLNYAYEAFPVDYQKRMHFFGFLLRRAEYFGPEPPH